MGFDGIKGALNDLLKQAEPGQGRHGMDGSDPVTDGPQVPLLQRSVLRSQGCWNCKHFMDHQASLPRIEERLWYWSKDLIREELEHLDKRATPDEKTMKKVTARVAKKVQQAMSLYQQTRAGICMLGKHKDLYNGRQAEFGSYKYLCEDGWSGVAGTVEQVKAGQADPSAAEVKDILDGGGKPKGGTLA